MKLNQEAHPIFLGIIPSPELHKISREPKIKTLELKEYEIKIAVPESGDESAQTYFPSTLGSYWVYEDQDGNDLTRTAVEDEEIADETYQAFSYELALEDWINYNPFIRPALYQISDTGIKLLVGDEVEKALKARLINETNMYAESVKNVIPPGEELDLTFDVEVEGQEHYIPSPRYYCC